MNRLATQTLEKIYFNKTMISNASVPLRKNAAFRQFDT